MKLLGLTSAAVLVFSLGSVIPGYCQERPEEAKPAQEQPRPEKTPDVKPEQEAPKAQPEKQEKQDKAQQEDRRDEQDKRAQEEKKGQEQDKNVQGKQGKEEKQMSASSGKRGGHIPDDKFRSHFGRQHTFVINRPVIVENRPRFQYGGYWFEFVDAWPADWSYSDNCYIDYVDDAYYLFDPLHPGIRIALFVVL